MALQVVGAGVGRTGTHSLKVALEQLLGGRCHHMVEVFADPEQIAGWSGAIEGQPTDWHALLRDFVAQTDWPGASFWPELSAAFPDALVILSVRPAEDWYRSASNTIFNFHTAPPEVAPWLTTFRGLMRERFSDQVDDPAAMIAAYERHNDAVRAAIPPERLLEWAPSDGWDPLCDRLGVPVPYQPFPVTNTTNELRALMGLDPIA